MYQLRYQIINLAPIIFSARHGDANMVGSLQYIPGTSVLGMLATRFLCQKKIASPDACSNKEFHKIFLKGDNIFSNAYIFFKDKDKEEYTHFPVPVSIHEEKGGDQIYDLLWCSNDDYPKEQTKAMQGFCHIEEGHLRFMEVETNLNFHHARDREKGISEEGKIFNYQSISKDQTFQGFIRGNSESLKDLVSACGFEWVAHLGRSKNAQYGKVNFEFLDITPQPVPDKILTDEELSLTLLSDTILYNENGFSTTDPDVMEKYLGVEIKKSFVRQNDAETFVSAWGLKKPSETCFKAGSCFLIKPADNDQRMRLTQFQKTGIGERTHEGFGQCIVGWQSKDELTRPLLREPEPDRPKTQIPETAEEILKTLIWNRVRNEVALDAMVDMARFKKLPTSSLISRLYAMANNPESEKFTESLNNFRKLAKEKLGNCRNNQQNLMDFLKDKTVSVNNVLQKSRSSDMRKLCTEIGYTPEDDKDFEKGLYRIYLATFFSSMRKAKIKAQEETHEKR